MWLRAEELVIVAELCKPKRLPAKRKKDERAKAIDSWIKQVMLLTHVRKIRAQWAVLQILSGGKSFWDDL